MNIYIVDVVAQYSQNIRLITHLLHCSYNSSEFPTDDEDTIVDMAVYPTDESEQWVIVHSHTVLILAAICFPFDKWDLSLNIMSGIRP